MTAQVGILNSEVAVLASDTAGSSYYGKSVKIFKSIKKIHKLADNLPVAIMVYGSARLSSVLWSRVIDLFKKQLGGEEKNKLKDYLDGFINFIENNSELTNYERNIDFFISWAKKIYINLEDMAYKNGDLNEVKFKFWINEENEELKRNEKSVLDDSKYNILVKSFDSYLANISSINYVKHPRLLKRFRDEIKEYLTLLFVKSITNTFESGVVIAGFGKDDIYPSLINVYIEGLFENKLRMAEPKYYMIGEDYLDKTKSTARIIPFAQADGVTLFMEGFAPEIKNFVLETSRNNTDEILSFLQNHNLFNGLSKEKRLKILNDLNLYSDRQFKEYTNNIGRYTYSNYTDPIVNSV